ncbi:hypothetical protein [uncultured Winogradskyella sp.]|uniref:hypothetical protein n=1 Tax=uncultured Winogradskyella sp. TaxID=395353 RepID=UPI002628FE74|nr:hypothetical protein [uncultured Winogradskyella sp.]
MKTLKMLVLVVAITFSSVLSASTNPIKNDEPTSISKTVGELLKNPDFQLNQEVDAVVDIFINDDNEIVVLSVETDNTRVEKYIKSRLNYKKVSNETLGYKKSFKVPVKMVKSN